MKVTRTVSGEDGKFYIIVESKFNHKKGEVIQFFQIIGDEIVKSGYLGIIKNDSKCGGLVWAQVAGKCCVDTSSLINWYQYILA